MLYARANHEETNLHWRLMHGIDIEVTPGRIIFTGGTIIIGGSGILVAIKHVFLCSNCRIVHKVWGWSFSDLGWAEMHTCSHECNDVKVCWLVYLMGYLGVPDLDLHDFLSAGTFF